MDSKEGVAQLKHKSIVLFLIFKMQACENKNEKKHRLVHKFLLIIYCGVFIKYLLVKYM
jgi:hypothetical protein